MKRTYNKPEAEAFLFSALELLMASGESGGGSTGGSTGGGTGDGNSPWIGDDGVIHLPPIPLE